MLFHFGRDVNINWKHGVNALPKDEQTGKGRISIIVWGMVRDCIEERGSPDLLRNLSMKALKDEKGEPINIDAYTKKVMDADLAIEILEEYQTSGKLLRRQRDKLFKIVGITNDSTSGCFTCGL